MAGSQKIRGLGRRFPSFSQGDIFRYQPLVLVGRKVQVGIFLSIIPCPSFAATRLQQPLRPVSSLGRRRLEGGFNPDDDDGDDDFNDDGVVFISL